MKTKTAIVIISLVIASVIFGTLGFVLYVQIQCESLPGYWHSPRPPTLENCFKSLQQNEKSEHVPYDDDHLRKLHCVQTFDRIYEQFLKQPSCPNSDSVCEPVLFESVIRENKEFNESSCVYDFDEWAYFSEYNDAIWHSLSHQYSLIVPKENPSDKPIPLTIEEWGYHMCNDFNVTIISHDEKREVVWQYKKTNLCVVADPAKWQKFMHKIPNSTNPFVLEPGNYYAILYYGNLIPVDSLLDYDNEVDELAKVYFGVKNEN